MNWRNLIFLFSFLMFSPAVLLLMAGFMVVPPIVIIGLSNWNFGGLVYLFSLIGGGVGLATAFFITFDLAGKTVSYINMQIKRSGLIFGVMSELFVFQYITPNFEPFLYYWLPPLFGAVVLLTLSFTITANKAFKQDK
ncbi:hypothetical protein H4J45_18570 [Colwellia sp. BRX10-6]|uniref:hypothetical protein n=1 Tax=unclassified Colwellia TaxID=196834 RepID=UPI0015F7052D|nr:MULTISPECIES: hypothetical protein [unclassified Colwellia]MBA6385226.1 hypothetical protein [Colwellia sp. BRX10-9]MBA6396082.1 hypothetical protein [Colwellia sp. BRX10-6]